MKIDPSIDYRGTYVTMTVGHCLPVLAKGLEPTALNMRRDLAKAKIAAEYNPTELEYQRRLVESAHLNKRH